ncbi:MAG: hypothetical protein QMD46_10840 [Methanomicrobiales archaeon]|nr:hypothetical protein [Methanomicrobiales archaeon]MDI6876601.1 hypothetical protein [Methanomicrobiales archaeon]
MEFALHPLMVVSAGTFAVAFAPAETVASALNGVPALSRPLYICGDRSAVLCRVRRAALDLRCARNPRELRSSLQGVHHPLVLIEHDPAFYGDRSLIPPLAAAMREAARTAAVVCHAAAPDASARLLAKLADRVFYLEVGLPRRQQRPARKASSSRQTTLSAR